MRKPTDTPVEVHFDTLSQIPDIEALAAKDGMKRKRWIETQILKIVKRRAKELNNDAEVRVELTRDRRKKV